MKFSAGGFRDFTRIAASDPTMWRDVFLANKDAVLEMLGRFNEDLSALTRAIRRGDGDALFDHFTRTRAIRRGIVDDRPGFGGARFRPPASRPAADAAAAAVCGRKRRVSARCHARAASSASSGYGLRLGDVLAGPERPRAQSLVAACCLGRARRVCSAQAAASRSLLQFERRPARSCAASRLHPGPGIPRRPALREHRQVGGTTQLNIISLDGKVTTLADRARSVFGEGLTILNDEIVQLTWQERQVFVYDLAGKLKRQMRNPRDGWGLTNDGTNLMFTDGGPSFYYADPKTFKIGEIGHDQSRQAEQIAGVNELELRRRQALRQHLHHALDRAVRSGDGLHRRRRRSRRCGS